MDFSLLNAYNTLIVLQKHKGRAMTVQELKSYVYPGDVETVRNAIKLLQDAGAPIEHTGFVQGSWALLDGAEYISGLKDAVKNLQERIKNAEGFNM